MDTTEESHTTYLLSIYTLERRTLNWVVDLNLNLKI